ncbi:MAG: threonine--tRNA ligase [Chitinophagales bacterium]|nr:threonine--tRNA ligase [Chitinophagales bacterium]MCZ2394650.1 threonine--tRNA ligase [Chitinophagales bacterium]
MSQINITFPDGSLREYAKGISAIEIAKGLSNSLAKKVLAAKVNGEVWDCSRPITDNSTLQLLTWEDAEAQSTFWHSSAHLMAEALESLYEGVKFGIGPPIENGFYYDIDLGGKTLSTNDFEAIEKKMRQLAETKSEYVRAEVKKEDAIKYFTQKGDQYKLELLDGLEDGKITFYTQGNFTDLCRGPHIPNTSHIKAIKLTKVAGAYWRGDDSRPQLTRVYGITFPKQEQLDEYNKLIEEALKRDHRKLGKELELFTFSDKVGMGLPLWLPNGTLVRDKLVEFLKAEQIKRGYKPVVTPHIGKKDLYITSGHYEKYGKDSFQPILTPEENEEFFLKPMNCPHHCEIYKFVPKSYRELPYRVAEFGTVYRYEQSGELHGLTRVRGFTQDDAHIFCTAEQLKGEFKEVISLIKYVFNRLGFEKFTAQISLRDPEKKEKYIGSEDNWHKAEQAIIEATEEMGLETITELGEAAFYGPKLDFMVKDAIGRSWQLGTIQVDYNLPERFDLEYIGADNEKHRPIMIHRAPFGSLERFMAILIEHCAGNFPLWLAPRQVAILPISDKFTSYSEDILNTLLYSDVRAHIDTRPEKIGRKIRDAEVSKVPYMIIIGEKEMDNDLISIRRHGEGDIGHMSIDEFMKLLTEENYH